MHDDQPTLIMVKRAIAGPEIITPGMGYKKARKAMLHAEGLDAGAPCPSSGPAEHPAQAETPAPSDIPAQLKRMADEMSALADQVEKSSDSSEDESVGEQKDL